MSKKMLDQIPQVQIQAPLPEGELEEGAFLHVSMSPFRHYEEEMVLAVVGTASIREGRWYAIPADVFTQIACDHPWTLSVQNIANAAWAMAEKGLLEIVSVAGEGDYVVPSVELIDALLHSCLAKVAEKADR